MDANRGLYSVEMMAKVLNVSPRSYYNYKKEVYRTREKKKEELMQQIVDVYFLSKGRYGSPRIAADLCATGYPVSVNTVAHYMHEMGMRSKYYPRFKVTTTDSNHNYYIAPNLLERKFKVDQAGMVWVTDITYIQTKDGFIYLTTVIDLFDRKVTGWSVSDNMSATCTTVAALEMAISRRTPKAGLIVHSDRGSQYACDEFAKSLKANNMVQSMSRKGNCWDNAVAESFFKTLKCELIYGGRELSAAQMELELFEYIEIWYNRKRRHSTLDNMTIEEFWRKIDPKNIDNNKSCA